MPVKGCLEPHPNYLRRLRDDAALPIMHGRDNDFQSFKYLVAVGFVHLMGLHLNYHTPMLSAQVDRLKGKG